MLEKRTEEDNNHFTLDDIYTALDCYNEKYVRFPRKNLERITGVSMPANKRNGRKQKEHINMMNMIRDVINKNVEMDLIRFNEQIYPNHNFVDWNKFYSLY